MKPISLNTRPVLREFLLLTALMIVLTLPFWLSQLDIIAAGRFYHPDLSDNPWPDENLGLWDFLYEAAPILALLLLLGALGVLGFSGTDAKTRLTRRRALFVLLSVMLGPGLIVNLVFKDHYGRPRPRQIEQFQGHLTYQPPGLPGEEGKSFPCGHCSVGFVTWVFYFLTRRKRAGLATGILFAATTFGVLIGIGRMAAGAHFLSDIIWSGLLSYAVCTLLYHPLVGRWENKPQAEIPEFFLLARWQALPPSTRPWVMGAVAALLTVAGALAIPYKTQTRLEIPVTSTGQPPLLTIDAKVGDIIIRQTGPVDGAINALLSYKGFGFPTSHIDGIYRAEQNTLEIMTTGLFTDVEGRLELTLPVNSSTTLHADARTGRIFLEPGVGPNWQLEAGRGVIREPLLERRFGK